MPLDVEFLLHRLLQENSDTAAVATKLLEEIQSWPLAPDDCHAVSSFLYTTGFYTALIGFNKQSLKRSRAVSWHYLGLLAAQKFKEHRDLLIKALANGAFELQQEQSLLPSFIFDDYDERVKSLREFRRHLDEKQLLSRRNSLLEQIKRLKEQGKFEEELRFINRFILAFPLDTEGPKLKAQFEQEHGLKSEALSNRPSPGKKSVEKGRGFKTLLLPRAKISFTTEEAEQLEVFYQSLLKQTLHQPELFLDATFVFIFMESWDYAVKLCEMALLEHPRLHERDQMAWLLAELYVLAGLYGQGLDWCQKLKAHHQHSLKQDKALNLHYLLALCYAGLEQRDEAIKHLLPIFELHPEFRLTSYYFHRWSER